MDAEALNAEGRAIWDAKAEFWDELHGDEGNRFHRCFVGPSIEHLLALQPGERVLDIACGNGTVARRLAALGGRVTAVDFSAALIEKAQARGQQGGEPIQYGVADATDEAALVALGEGVFDALTCTMALMDMPVIAPLYRAARRLLQPGGRLVIATAHPAFNSNNPIFYAEKRDENGQLIETVGVKISGYLDVPPVKGAGAPGEPEPHTYYHRTLSDLLNEAFAAGLVLDGLDERGYTPVDDQPPRLLSWSSLPQIPPVLAVRLRPSPHP
jgi:2-polyprenyl-3-methyl-5-hydroxy-6-metoxy-1,4-benzoquinol methylase